MQLSRLPRPLGAGVVRRGRLEAQGLTVLDVNRAIAREHLEVPAGRIETAEREMNVRAEGEAIDIEAFRSLVVAYRDKAPIRLKDVAVVEDGLEDRRRIGRSMGEPSIGFGITKLRGANAVQVGRDVKAKTGAAEGPASRRAEPGRQLGHHRSSWSRPSTRSSSPWSWPPCSPGLVCWLFLGSWSTTLNVLLAIPTSILGTFIVMYVFGFTLNTFTVLGLTLVVGIVVDDAIMVLENIYRHREEGMGKVRAASVGAREITFAAAAATFAIVAIFLPVAFMKGIIGKFFFQFGVTISVAVLISLLEALTLAPMRCSRFLTVEKRGPHRPRGGVRLRAALRRLSPHPEAGPPPPRPGHGRGHRALRRSPWASSSCSAPSSCPARTWAASSRASRPPWARASTPPTATSRSSRPSSPTAARGRALRRASSAASGAARSTPASSSRP